MGSKVQAGRRGWELELKLESGSPIVDVPAAPLDPELEAEVDAVSAWFEALPAEWKAYFDHEARRGREAYACL